MCSLIFYSSSWTCQVYPCICSMSNWNVSVALFKACMRNYAQYCNIPAWVDTMQSVEVIMAACICHYRLSQLVGAFCSISKWNKIATLFRACEATTRLLSWHGIVCPYVITIKVIITRAVHGIATYSSCFSFMKLSAYTFIKDTNNLYHGDYTCYSFTACALSWLYSRNLNTLHILFS